MISLSMFQRLQKLYYNFYFSNICIQYYNIILTIKYKMSYLPKMYILSKDFVCDRW